MSSSDSGICQTDHADHCKRGLRQTRGAVSQARSRSQGKCQPEPGNRYFPAKTSQQLFRESTKLPSSEEAFLPLKFTGPNFKISSGAYISHSHYVYVTIDRLRIDQSSAIVGKDSCQNRNIGRFKYVRMQRVQYPCIQNSHFLTQNLYQNPFSM